MARSHVRSAGVGLAGVLISLFFLMMVAAPLLAEVVENEGGLFKITHEVHLPGDPKTAYDVWDGDISEWWDHTFSDLPEALYIEAKPGGHFVEVFDGENNGCIHATVIYADRGKKLSMRGPLGFSGSAIDLVFTLNFEPRGVDTLLKFTLDGMGRTEEGWVDAIDGVWHHFLVEQLKPYMEAGKRLEDGQ